MRAELKWMGDSLWLFEPTTDPWIRAGIKRQCVGTVKPTKRGTYWAVHFYMGNVRAALPTEQEARDLLMVIAGSHYGVA